MFQSDEPSTAIKTNEAEDREDVERIMRHRVKDQYALRVYALSSFLQTDLNSSKATRGNSMPLEMTSSHGQVLVNVPDVATHESSIKSNIRKIDWILLFLMDGTELENEPLLSAIDDGTFEFPIHMV